MQTQDVTFQPDPRVAGTPEFRRQYFLSEARRCQERARYYYEYAAHYQALAESLAEAR